MKIKGIDGLTLQQVQDEVNRGGKFVLYNYCVSLLIVSFKRPSDIHFIRADQNAVVKGLPYTLVSLLLGWWGIPWGIIYTFGSLGTNLSGGKNLTQEVMGAIHQQTGGPVFEFEDTAAATS